MSDTPELHPIQLKEIFVSELSALVHDQNAARDFQGNVNVKTKMGNTPYEEGSSFVGVRVDVSVAPALEEGKECPSFEFSVKLEGHFEVDFTKFKPEYIDEWARVNAIFLIMPYVREHMYGLALRTGIRGIVLPMLVIPRLPSKGPVPPKEDVASK